jgi:hypothetical protein
MNINDWPNIMEQIHALTFPDIKEAVNLIMGSLVALVIARRKMERTVIGRMRVANSAVIQRALSRPRPAQLKSSRRDATIFKNLPMHSWRVLTAEWICSSSGLNNTQRRNRI